MSKKKKDTPCFKYLQKLQTICFLNIFHIPSSYMKGDHYYHLVEWGVEKKKKKVYLSSARCAHCMLRYLMQGPGDWKCSCQAF